MISRSVVLTFHYIYYKDSINNVYVKTIIILCNFLVLKLYLTLLSSCMAFNMGVLRYSENLLNLVLLTTFFFVTTTSKECFSSPTFMLPYWVVS